MTTILQNAEQPFNSLTWAQSGQMNEPNHLSVDRNAFIIVADCNNTHSSNRTDFFTAAFTCHKNNESSDVNNACLAVMKLLKRFNNSTNHSIVIGQLQWVCFKK
jgi:hypothetical protein